MVTMADVARVAGVHASTVSHVLNGTRTVNDDTRERVLRAIVSTGYRHNVLARSLATSSTMALGLAISSVANPYLGDLIRSVDAGARAAGYILMLGDTYDDAEIERKIVEQLVDRRVDGIILAPSPRAVTNGALPFLKSSGVPTILMDRFADAELDQIAPENFEATVRLADHLADLGHRRIAMVTGLAGLHSTDERIAGFQQVVTQRGLDPDPALLLNGASETVAAEKAVLEAFSGKGRPSAVVVGNNAMTIGTVRALRTLRLRIPEDVALVCYDDFDWADLFEPRLSAMRQDISQMGWRAVELMVKRIAEPSAPVTRHRVKPTYQHRSSCGCPSPQPPPAPPSSSAASPAEPGPR